MSIEREVFGKSLNSSMQYLYTCYTWVAKHSDLLEKDGGQWRFQNYLLQDRLGELYSDV